MFFDPPGKLLDEPHEPRFPAFLLARVDQIEFDEESEEDGTVLFDCLEMDWVTEQGIDSPPIAARSEEEGGGVDMALFILAIGLQGMRKLVGELANDAWYKFELGVPDKHRLIAEQYSALFTDPNARGVISAQRIDDLSLKSLLDRLAGWDGAIASPAAEIDAALQPHGAVDGVAIYDVGQGAATALLSGVVPQLYFDFGGSVIGNWRSFPRHLSSFCFTSEPTIVLSHWDWDHWSSALIDRNALRQTWLLPVQRQSGPLGGVHARFLSLVRQHGKVVWWDDAPRQIYIAPTLQLRLFGAGGPRSDRNESGLVLRLIEDGSPDPIVQLQGDAACANCDLTAHQHVEYLLAPHHGGKTDLGGLPGTQRNKTDYIIYSNGVGNTFSHPRSDTIKAFRTAYPKNAHCALRNHTGFGHVGIDLNDHAPRESQVARERRLTERNANAELPCPGYCQLDIQQWI
jgi:beta-lactamase superfamily II metal-dependent hydrolase